MQDMIASGVTWFESQRKLHMAVTVEYWQLGAASATNVPATIGGSRFESADGTGQILRHESRDYIVGVDDYSAAPVRGDRIIETVDSVRRIYEVAAPIGSGNPWQWADRSQRSRRIHTVYVGVDA